MHHCTYLQKGGWVGINWRRISQDTTVNGEEGSHDKLDFLLAIDYWLAIECTISMENVKVYFRKWKWDEHEIEMFSSQWRKYKDRFSLKSAQKSTDAQNSIFTCKMSPEWRLSGSPKYNRPKYRLQYNKSAMIFFIWNDPHPFWIFFHTKNINFGDQGCPFLHECINCFNVLTGWVENGWEK